MEIERIDLLGVPLDIVPAESLEDCINSFLRDEGGGEQNSRPPLPTNGGGGRGKNIVLLSIWDMLKARRPGDYRDFVTGAALVIPISKSLAVGARFLTGKTPVRYMPFDFVIRLLSCLELREETVYILGGKTPVLRKAEQNVRETFPRLRVIGRYPGLIRKQDEEAVLLSIRKCAPSLLMIGHGVRGNERWLSRNDGKLTKNLRLWVSDILEIFAEKRKRPSKFAFDHGLEWLGFCARKPYLLFRIFPFLYYQMLLIVHKIKNGKHKGV